jgi:hypothetical protein
MANQRFFTRPALNRSCNHHWTALASTSTGMLLTAPPCIFLAATGTSQAPGRSPLHKSLGLPAASPPPLHRRWLAKRVAGL